MRVIIPATEVDCAASLALRKEGVEHEVCVMDDDYDYANLLVELWLGDDGFVLIEHDIVAWPGAIDEIIHCPELWCSYRYPLAPNTYRPALGCIKVSPVLIQSYRHLPDKHGWAERTWSQLDGPVCSALESVTGKTHIHNPPLAHVKR